MRITKITCDRCGNEMAKRNNCAIAFSFIVDNILIEKEVVDICDECQNFLCNLMQQNGCNFVQTRDDW